MGRRLSAQALEQRRGANRASRRADICDAVCSPGDTHLRRSILRRRSAACWLSRTCLGCCPRLLDPRQHGGAPGQRRCWLATHGCTRGRPAREPPVDTLAVSRAVLPALRLYYDRLARAQVRRGHGMRLAMGSPCAMHAQRRHRQVTRRAQRGHQQATACARRQRRRSAHGAASRLNRARAPTYLPRHWKCVCHPTLTCVFFRSPTPSRTLASYERRRRRWRSNGRPGVCLSPKCLLV